MDSGPLRLPGGEITGVDRVSENSDRVRPQAPAVRLCSSAEFTPTGGVIRAVGHPQHWERLRPDVTGAAGSPHYGPLPDPGRWNTRGGVTCLPVK